MSPPSPEPSQFPERSSRLSPLSETPLPKESSEDFFRDRGLNPTFIVRLESPEDAAHRHELEKPEDAAHRREQDKFNNSLRRKKEAGIYIFACSIITAVAISCIIKLAIPNSTTEEKAWYQSTMTIIVGGVVGYLFGKTSSSDSKQ